MIIRARNMARAELARLERDLGGIHRRFSAVGTAARAVGRVTLIGTGIAAVGVAKLGGSVIHAAADFQDAMKMVKAVTGANAAQMALLSAKALALGADMRLPATSAVDAAVAFRELSKAGLSINDVLGAGRGVLQLAAAGELDVADAAGIAASQLNAFHLKGKEATRVADLLAAAANASQAEVHDVALAAQQAATSFFQARQPVEAMVTAISLMANAGIRGSDAGTSLKVMLQRLEAPTKKAKAAMDHYGIAVFDAQGKTRPLRDIIRDLEPVFARMTDAQRAAFTQTVFGTDAMRAANVVLGGGVKRWDAMTLAVTKQGAAAKLAAAKNEGLHGAMDAFRSVLDTLKVAMGTPTLKPLERLTLSFGSLLNTDKVIKWAQTTGEKIGAVLTKIADFVDEVKASGLNTALDKFMSAETKQRIDQVRDALSKARDVLGQIQNVIAQNGGLKNVLFGVAGGFTAVRVAVGLATGAFNPWLSVVGLVAGALIYAYTHSQKFREKVADLWGWIKNKLTPALQDLWNWVKTKVLPVYRELWQWVQDKVRPALSSLKDTIVSNKDQLKLLWAAFLVLMGFIIRTVVPWLIKLYTLYLVNLINVFKGVIIILGAVVRAGEFLVRRLLDFFGSILTGAAKAFGWMPGIGPKLRDAARDFGRFAADVNRSLDQLHDEQITVKAIADVDATRKLKKLNTQFGGKVQLATGGMVRGPGGPRDDAIPALLSNGEFVVNAAAARRNVGLLREINAQRFATGGVVPRTAFSGVAQAGKDAATYQRTVERAVISIAGRLATSVARAVSSAVSGMGSSLGGSAGIKAFIRSTDRLPYIWGGAGPGGYDCSGLVGAVYGMMRGDPRAGHGRRYFTTGSIGRGVAGLKSGFGGTLNIGVTPGIGHMAGNYGGLGFEARSTRSGIIVGGAARAVSSFARHYHMAKGGLVGKLTPGTVSELLKFPGIDIGGDLAAARVALQGFDRGGWLMPGATLAVNTTGRPERVSPPNGGGDFHLHVEFHGPVYGSKEGIRQLVDDIHQGLLNKQGRWGGIKLGLT
jgi:TP901 family phage tail tape measure protein